MKIPIIDNIVSSITPSSITETTKLLDNRLKENVMATNGDDFLEVNKKAGVDIIFYTQLCEIYDKAQEDDGL